MFQDEVKTSGWWCLGEEHVFDEPSSCKVCIPIELFPKNVFIFEAPHSGIPNSGMNFIGVLRKVKSTREKRLKHLTT